ncbi:hypothetical protein [Maritimibacter sp. UBA3975]|uniref:hypothetical protein n=1 Tax=Maritimibacter sp. UBA3975 TaxID=1946833 RepID=UPI000C0906C2|nr:hypothetical protein [Maritimibacter sp. UBA3975]MAM60560.1 hypothetical protein [Maritimibacter sp.]|tara:strand:- start:3965 stop:4345 length:381 start_codon:yes stop_codon:yes gene_type:complete
MRRRALLLASLAALATPLPAYAQLFRGAKRRRMVEACRSALGESFPADVMALPATEEFLAAYADHALDRPDLYPEDGAYFHFLTSTNVMVHVETGEPLSFDAIFDPQVTPCANHLGAFYAADGEHG